VPVESEEEILCANCFSVFSDQAIPGGQHPHFGTGFEFQKLGMLSPAGLGSFGPEIYTIDIAVGVPERFVVNVIVFLVCAVLERPPACDDGAIESGDGE
jgi:hypothetical protein